MSKFKPMELIGEMHGKFHGDSEYYAAERYGTQYTGKIGDNQYPPTEKQIAQRERFAEAKAKIAAQNRSFILSIANILLIKIDS